LCRRAPRAISTAITSRGAFINAVIEAFSG
jgi:hypothetical protein